MTAEISRFQRVLARWHALSHRAGRILTAVAGLGVFALPCVHAQSSGSQRPAPLMTLELWADNVWLALTDRDGSYFGRLAEQGTFQRFNPRIHPEYELDLRTGLFTESEDARWAVAERGLRLGGASIGHPLIVNAVDWRERVPITERVRLLARYRRQRTLTEQRDYPFVAVSWTQGRDSPWSLGVGIGVQHFKASADVEVALSRRWQVRQGVVSLGTRVAMLDVFNNVVFGALGVDPEETPAHFRYQAVPVAARIAASWSATATRFEVHAGASSRSNLEVSFPASGDPSYRQAEQVRFAGVLGEWAPTQRLRVGAYATTAGATTDRAFEPVGVGGFRLREHTQALGLRGATVTGGPFVIEWGVGGVWRPEERDRDDGTTVRHRDREVHAHLAFARRPVIGPTWRVAWYFDERAAGTLAPWLTDTNHRLPTEFGYRFQSGFEFAVGARWDLDNRFTDLFDGGHVRFTATWQ